jgi:CIC family chloride channel protein
MTDSERRRIPAPLIKRRMPSGRGAMEQPNATHDGNAALTPIFWGAVAVTGVATGLLGDLMMALLFEVQRLAFGYHSGSLQAGVEHASGQRRVLSLLVGGTISGMAWYLLRRFTPGEQSEIDDALWRGNGVLSLRRSLGTSVISEIAVGMGASLGREAAPKLLGGAAGTVTSRWLRLSPAQLRLLVACGGGAGLAAVYNVPLGGALFSTEILIGSISLPTVLAALTCSGIATATAWLYLPAQATYLDVPAYHSSAALLVWAVLLGPVVGLAAAGYIRLIGWVSYHRATGLTAIYANIGAFAVLGLIGLAYPQLFGNGKDLAHDAFLGGGSFGFLLALFILKPLVTAMCLGGGASGGLFTPVMSTGAALGGALGVAWTQLWPGSPIGAYAMIGAAALIGAAMQAPLTGLVLVLELPHSGGQLMVPLSAPTAIATLLARYLDGYSIYSARLPAGSTESGPAV